MRYSVIIPVYNRPQEVDELLHSLTKQSYKSFEVIIVEDGSFDRCDEIVEKYKSQLNIRYFVKENSGQGFSRNFGFARAEGDFFVVFDSDCLVPPHYFETVNNRLDKEKIDCWGGPDRAHPDFTPVQKAINYSMTSYFTTGGTRGNERYIGIYYPRSFNMGISREIYEKTGGYKITRMGEDLEFSIRIQKSGFVTQLIREAYVYHKRRTNFLQFYKQLFFFGRARINLGRFYPDQIKFIHIMPLLFTLGLFVSLLTLVFSIPYLKYLISVYIIFGIVLGLDSFRAEKSIVISLYSIIAGFIQLTGYGCGFAKELFQIKK